MGAKRKISFFLIVGAIPLICAGCAPSLALSDHNKVAAAMVPRLTRPRPDPVVAKPSPEDPTSLQELFVVATNYHPELRSAQANIEAARGRMIQAGLYPNPSFGPNFAELGDVDNRLGEPGARLSQTFVTANKLKIARAAGAHAVEAADWQAVTRLYAVITRVRGAYYELLTALREQETTQKIVKSSEEALQIAETLEKAGAGARPDILRARVELEQNRLKKEVSLRRVEAARENLRTAMGRPEVRLDAVEKNLQELDQTPPDYDWKSVLECVLDSSAELQEARALIAQQEKLVSKAQADAIPNVTATVIPFYESPTRNVHAEVFLQVPLPIFDRNQGNIYAAKADLVRSHNDERQLELRLTERLTAAFQRYQAARKQAESYEKNIMPKARESLELIEAGYKANDRKYDYTAVLQAQQVLFQAQLAQTFSLGELWRAVVDLAAILQQDNLHTGCGVK